MTGLKETEFVEDQLVKMFYGHLDRLLIVIPLLIVLVGVVIWFTNQHVILVYWTTGLCLAIFGIFLPLSRSFKRRPELLSSRQWEVRAAIGAFVVAFICGILPWLAFPPLDPILVVTFTAALVVAPAVTVAYYSYSQMIWLCTTGGLMLPLFAYTFTQWDFYPELGFGAAIWMLLYTAFTLLMSRDTRARWVEFFTLQYRLDQQRRKAEEISLAKTKFLAAASHDIRQPTDALSLLLAVLKHQSDDDQNTEIIKKMERNLSSQKAIYDTLMEISVLESDHLEFNFENLSTNNLILASVQPFEHQIRSKNLELLLPSTDHQVFSDKRSLLSILRNLISNAVKYTSEGKIEVRCESDAKSISLLVLDTGCGIADEELKHIFNEFYRVKKGTTSQASGFGLGLAIAQRTAALISCQINVTSQENSGSCFSIVVPKAQA